ncbi:MAG: N-acetyltransferase [Dehalococcoidia bacterium]
MKIEKAKIADVPQIHKLVNQFAANGQMLARSLSELYENMRDFFVVREENKVVGCAALHICWEDLVEIKSTAVSEKQRRQGMGAALVKACIAEARELDVATVFCLTYETEFFGKMGFQRVELMDLPRKVWGECQQCPKYPDCDEKAMVLQLKPQGKAKW